MRRTPEDASDGQLVEAAARGSEEAFLVLYRRHQGAIFRFALHMCGSRETAEEVTQEVFLALLASPGDYRQALGPLEAYLIGIARNRVRQQARAASRRRPVESAEAAAETEFADLEQRDELGRLREAVLALPANYREAVVLCDMEGVSYEEAARRLGCPVGTVRSRLHRARAILLAKLRRQTAAACARGRF